MLLFCRRSLEESKQEINKTTESEKQPPWKLPPQVIVSGNKQESNVEEDPGVTLDESLPTEIEPTDKEPE